MERAAGQPDLAVGVIVDRLGGARHGDAQVRVAGFAPLDRAAHGQLAFITDVSRLAELQDCQASCVILPESLADQAERFPAAIVTRDPYLYYARLSQWLEQLRQDAQPAAIHPSAVVDASARLGQWVRIDANAVVEAGSVIGDGCWIGAGAHVGSGVHLGSSCRLHPGAVVLHDCLLGQRCIIHSGAVIGSDGFGYARDEQGAGVKIPQLGSVRIGDDVEIGANTTIDRGALDDTVIGTGVKIDNLVQVAHNVRIGDHTALAGCVGIAGSATIGSYCFLGGGVGVAGHLEIADRVVIGGMSLVSRSVRQAGHYTGAFPLDTHVNWSQNAASLRHLADLRSRLRQLESAIQKLQSPNLPQS